MSRVLVTFMICAVTVVAFGGFFIGGIFSYDEDRNVGDAMQGQQDKYHDNFSNKHQVKVKESNVY